MKMLVTHKQKLSPQYFNPYYSSNHLLFQFVLSEFILAYREIQWINKITNKSEPSDFLDDSHAQSQTLHALALHVSKLAGSTHQHLRLLSWNDDGFLTKMKNYCALLCHNDNTENRDLYRMYQESSQAWLLSLRVLDAVRTLLQQVPIEKPLDQRIIDPSLKKLTNSLKRLSRLVWRSAIPFSHNENVVFFILRHKKQLDALYKPGFTRELIKKMFSKGINEACQFLLERYSIRGFNNLIPVINRKFAELEVQ